MQEDASQIKLHLETNVDVGAIDGRPCSVSQGRSKEILIGGTYDHQSVNRRLGI